jgi:hypothetical protein
MKTTSKFTVLRLPLLVLGLLFGIFANYILFAPPRMTKEDALILSFAEENFLYLTYRTRDNSNHFLRSAKTEVEKEGNPPESLAFLNKMNKIKESTTLMMEKIDEVGSIASKNKYETLAKGDSSTWRNDFSVQSKKIIDLYVALLKYDSLLISIDTVAKNALTKNKIAILTSDAEKNPLDKSTFEEYYFQTTEAVGLYNLARLQAEVAYREYVVMKAMNERMKRINLGDIKFDHVQPFATAESEVVEEGQPYKATVFFASYSKGWSEIPMRMRSSEGTVEVKDGIGKVRFKATADKFDANGLAKKTWKGSITLKTPRGTDTTFNVETEYFVKKKQ